MKKLILFFLIIIGMKGYSFEFYSSGEKIQIPDKLLQQKLDYAVIRNKNVISKEITATQVKAVELQKLLNNYLLFNNFNITVSDSEISEYYKKFVGKQDEKVFLQKVTNLYGFSKKEYLEKLEYDLKLSKIHKSRKFYFYEFEEAKEIELPQGKHSSFYEYFPIVPELERKISIAKNADFEKRRNF